MKTRLLSLLGFLALCVAAGCRDTILTVEDLGVRGEGSVVPILAAYPYWEGDRHYFQYRERLSEDDFPYFVVETDRMYKEGRNGGILPSRPEEFVEGREVRIWPYSDRSVGHPVPLAVLLRDMG
jgi:hypothetical protein